jgi:hypothetical protein
MHEDKGILGRISGTVKLTNTTMSCMGTVIRLLASRV